MGPQTYTSQFGNTPQGQGQQNFYNALQGITGMPKSDTLGQGQLQAQSGALAMQQNAPAFMQQANQSLTAQSGIPQLTSQYGNLGQIFDLYMHDQGLAQKYANPSLSTGQSPIYANAPQMQPAVAGVNPVANPYLGSTSDIINAATPQGQGFGTPSMVTGAMTQPINATENIMGLLQQALGSEQGLVANKMGDVSQNYQAGIGALTNLANIFEQERGNQLSMMGASSPYYDFQVSSAMAQDAQNGLTLNQMMQKYSQLPGVTANKILQLYNENSMYGQAQETPEQLASQYGISGGFGKNPPTKTVKNPDGTTTVTSLQPDGTYGNPQTIGTPQKGLLQSVLGAFTGLTQDPNATGTKLRDPQGNVYQYSSTSDPDYQSDLKKGWQPA